MFSLQHKHQSFSGIHEKARIKFEGLKHPILLIAFYHQTAFSLYTGSLATNKFVRLQKNLWALKLLLGWGEKLTKVWKTDDLTHISEELVWYMLNQGSNQWKEPLGHIDAPQTLIQPILALKFWFKFLLTFYLSKCSLCKEESENIELSIVPMVWCARWRWIYAYLIHI